MPNNTRCATEYKECVVAPDSAEAAYIYLRDQMQWREGVRSKRGPTRRACPLGPGDDAVVDNLANLAIEALATKYNYVVAGIYLNYYEDGGMWTPNHSHPGSHQVVVSLGAERPLTVAGKTFMMKSGSAIIFGSATHGVPKFPTAAGGRISIALFLTPIPRAH